MPQKPPPFLAQRYTESYLCARFNYRKPTPAVSENPAVEAMIFGAFGLILTLPIVAGALLLIGYASPDFDVTATLSTIGLGFIGWATASLCWAFWSDTKTRREWDETLSLLREIAAGEDMWAASEMGDKGTEPGEDDRDTLRREMWEAFWNAERRIGSAKTPRVQQLLKDLKEELRAIERAADVTSQPQEREAVAV